MHSIPSQWKHILTDRNPAHIPTRLPKISDLAESSLWWNAPQRLPQGAFYVPRLTPKPKITKPNWAVNNKTTHFRYNASFVTFAQTFKAEDFDKLAINALSAITPDIESDHKHTCYDFVSTIRLWYETVDYLR